MIHGPTIKGTVNHTGALSTGAMLVEASASFEVTPLPFDNFQFEIKAEPIPRSILEHGMELYPPYPEEEEEAEKER